MPIMMMRDFKSQALNYLGSLKEFEGNDFFKQKESKENNSETLLNNTTQGTFNLITPRSSCPSCSHQITAIENIPLISYLFLRGKCSNCKTPISIRYPSVELVTGIISGFLAWHFGFSWQLLGALIFSYALICQAMIDWDTQYLLDDITYPMLWLGILFNTQNIFTSLDSAVLGAIIGYLSLWSVFVSYKLLTGKEGMGYGDFKLLALLGAWLGWQSIPLIILLSSVVGTIIGSIIIFQDKRKNTQTPISFGPYLAIAGWISLVWGEQLIEGYLRVVGI